MANTHSLDLEQTSSQYAYCADNADVSVTGDLTLEAWVKLETDTVDMAIAAKHGLSDHRSYLFMFDETSGSYYLKFFTYADGSNSDLKQIAWNPNVDTWYHLAVVYDDSTKTAEFFVNGSSIGSDTGSVAGIADTDAIFAVGALSAGTGAFWDGKIDEVRLWDDIRTSTEIDDNKSVELVGTETNLVGYWKLNNNTDDSCKSSDLTLVGSPSYSDDVPFVGATTITKTHTTDSTFKKVNTKTHTTDSSLYKVQTLLHTTDSSLKKVYVKTHTTDSYLRGLYPVVTTQAVGTIEKTTAMGHGTIVN